MAKYERIFKKQVDFFKSGQTKNYEFRKRSLKQLRKAIKKNEGKITAALNKDLNKSAFESYSTEIGVLLNEISFRSEERRVGKECRTGWTAYHYRAIETYETQP